MLSTLENNAIVLFWRLSRLSNQQSEEIMRDRSTERVGADHRRRCVRSPVAVTHGSPFTFTYRLVMRNTSQGPRCVHRSPNDWGNDSNGLGRSGMRLVGVRRSLPRGENPNGATARDIGRMAVNRVRWANCDNLLTRDEA